MLEIYLFVNSFRRYIKVKNLPVGCISEIFKDLHALRIRDVEYKSGELFIQFVRDLGIHEFREEVTLINKVVKKLRGLY
jgi:hypothetical protein